MIVIRFVRVGRNKQAYFHLVAAEKARAVQKKYIEKLGHYNPHSNSGEGELVFNEDRVKHFIKNGAQLSQTVARLLVTKGFKEAGKFVTERATKPKRTEPPKTEAPAEETKEPEDVAAEKTDDKEEEESKDEPAPEAEETTSEEVKEDAPAEEEDKKEN
ncbi:30S ribosomal protein S16 [Candidatus Gracilibacteria bacterium]|nr:30S ribosomal protein S16 [Candidatus Gracilibacteria bacterium]